MSDPDGETGQQLADANAHYNEGITLAGQGKLDEAITEFRVRDGAQDGLELLGDGRGRRLWRHVQILTQGLLEVSPKVEAGHFGHNSFGQA